MMDKLLSIIVALFIVTAGVLLIVLTIIYCSFVLGCERVDRWASSLLDKVL